MFLIKNKAHRTKIESQIANALTLMNLSSSIFAIILITNGFFHTSVLFLLIAAIFDRFDGIAARKFQCESEFGKELDSLSDLVSFGVAPALLLYQAAFHTLPGIGIGIAILYILAGAIRLARYNVTSFDGAFVGLPITAAGVFMVVLFFTIPYVSTAVLALLVGLLSYLMVSNIRITKV